MGTYIKLKCPTCDMSFNKPFKEYNRANKRGHAHVCSRACRDKKRSFDNTTKTHCTNCDKSLIMANSAIKKSKSGNHFCSRSCAATYNNKNKTYGTRRSKLEVFIEDKLQSELPDLIFIANSKKVIGSELDFYFPDLKLAIEVNGPLHYKPIYGEKKFLQIQANDQIKISACQKANITLAIVDNLKDYTKSYVNDRWTIIKQILIK